MPMSERYETLKLVGTWAVGPFLLSIALKSCAPLLAAGPAWVSPIALDLSHVLELSGYVGFGCFLGSIVL